MASLGDKPWRFRPGIPPDHRSLNDLAELISRSLRGGPGVNVQSFGDRVLISLAPTVPALPEPRNYFQQYVVVEELDDLLRCAPFVLPDDGTVPVLQEYDDSLGADSGAFTYVAKPYYLQKTPWQSKTLSLAAGTYSVDYGAVGSRTLTGAGGTAGTLRQAITPQYLPGEVILATRAVTGLYGPDDGGPVSWMDANEAGRTWGSDGLTEVCDTSASGGATLAGRVTLKRYRPEWDGTVLKTIAWDEEYVDGLLARVGCESVVSRHDVCDCSDSGGGDGGGDGGGGPILVSCCPEALDTPLCVTFTDVGGNAPSVAGKVLPIAYYSSVGWSTPSHEFVYGLWYGAFKMTCPSPPPSQDYWMEFYWGCARSGWYWSARRVIVTSGGTPATPTFMPNPQGSLAGVVCDPLAASIPATSIINACTDDGVDVASVSAAIAPCSGGGGGSGVSSTQLGSTASTGAAATLTLAMSGPVPSGKLILVSVGHKGSAGGVTGVTAGGVAMTKAADANASTTIYGEVWSLVTAGTVSGNVVVTFSGNYSAAAVAAEYVDGLVNNAVGTPVTASHGTGTSAAFVFVGALAAGFLLTMIATAAPGSDPDGSWTSSPSGLSDGGQDTGTTGAGVKLCTGHLPDTMAGSTYVQKSIPNSRAYALVAVPCN